MRLVKLVIGELVVLIASILIFRSLWIMLDQYLDHSNLEITFIIGISIAILGLILLNKEIKQEPEKTSKTSKAQLQLAS
ncbi:MAG: hypothetical protein FWG55_08425 [Candidatus Bathyarchaeota archaeon]|nr:hypothetical protein [Candidatus Termiticorpusculum sp.]